MENTQVSHTKISKNTVLGSRVHFNIITNTIIYLSPNNPHEAKRSCISHKATLMLCPKSPFQPKYASITLLDMIQWTPNKEKTKDHNSVETKQWSNRWSTNSQLDIHKFIRIIFLIMRLFIKKKKFLIMRLSIVEFPQHSCPEREKSYLLWNFDTPNTLPRKLHTTKSFYDL